MSSLFELVDEFKELYEMAIDGDEQVFKDTLESLTGELEVKAGGYTAVINQLTMEQEKADELSKKYAEIRDGRKNAIKRMKDTHLMAMDALEKNELPAGDFKIKVKANGGKQALMITGPVPDNMNKVTVEPDNDKIRNYLKDVEGNKCEWAYLCPRGKHIEIKEG